MRDPSMACPNAARWGNRTAARGLGLPCLTAALDAMPEPTDQAGYADASMGWYGFWEGLEVAKLGLCPACAHGLPAVLPGASLWVTDVHREGRAWLDLDAFNGHRTAAKLDDLERRRSRPATVAPRCTACPWVGISRNQDDSPGLRLAHRQADGHAKTVHQDNNRPNWPRKRAGGVLVLVPMGPGA